MNPSRAQATKEQANSTQIYQKLPKTSLHKPLSPQVIRKSYKDRVYRMIEKAPELSIPSTHFADVIGLQHQKEALLSMVVSRLRSCDEEGEEVWGGITQLVGPSGCGKFMLAEACANEASAFFLTFSVRDLCDAFGQRSLDFIVNVAKLAVENKPSLVYVSDVEYFNADVAWPLNKYSHSLMKEFLIQVRYTLKCENQVSMIISTNQPWAYNRSVLENVERVVYVPLPDSAARKELVRKLGKEAVSQMSDEHWERLAEGSEMYSMDEIYVAMTELLAKTEQRRYSGTELREGKEQLEKADFVHRVTAVCVTQSEILAQLRRKAPATTEEEIMKFQMFMAINSVNR